MKRHSNALFIQMGACNPSGIAHAIIDACREMREQPNHAGTQEICDDPAIRLMVHQLAFLTRVSAVDAEYDQLTKVCEENKG